MRGTTPARARGRRGRDPQAAVQAAVAAAHRTRPGVGAHAGQHAAWWARNSATLKLISKHEVDPVRAQAARADAVTAWRLAEAMAAAHTAQLSSAESQASPPEASVRVGGPRMGKSGAFLAAVPQSTAGYDAAAAELPDVSDLHVLEVGL
jgi:hypothetical protein